MVAFNASNVRGACTVDGTAFWVTGNGSTAASAGVQYVTLGATTTPTQIFSTITNMRQVHVYGSQLYASTGSTAATGTGVYAIGTGTPTTTGQTGTRLATTVGPNSFAVLDLDPNVAGVDTIYVANDTGGVAATVNLQKWTFNGTVWAPATFVPTAGTTGAVNLLGLTTWLEGTAVHIVVTTTESPARIL